MSTTSSMETFHQVAQIRNEIEQMSKVSKGSKNLEFAKKALDAEDKLEELRVKIEKNFARNQSDDAEYLLETIKETISEIAFFVKNIFCPAEPGRITD